MAKHYIFAKVRPGRLLRYSFVIGLASLLWLILRTGTKPTRAGYPCQRMAAANASAWLGAAAVPALLRWTGRLRQRIGSESRLSAAIIIIFAAALFTMLFGWPSLGLFSDAAVGISTLVSPGTGNVVSPEGPIDLKLEQHLAGPPTRSDIFVVEGTTGADNGFDRLISLLEEHGDGFYKTSAESKTGSLDGGSGVIGSDDVVIIKVNSQWNQRGGTNTDLTASIIRAVIDHPNGFSGEVIIADNGQAQYGSAGRGGSLDWGRNNSIDYGRSMQDVANEFAAEYRVSTYLWDAITRNKVAEFSEGDIEDGYIVAGKSTGPTGIIVSYPKFTTRYGTHISFKRGVWDPASRTYDTDRLTVINVPVLKSHAIYGVTGAVKHYMGVVSDKLTSHNAHRSVGDGGMGTQMVQTRVPALNIIDAIWINARPGRGPSTSFAAADEVNVIAASLDPVALDTWGSINLLIAAAEQRGYGRTQLMSPLAPSGSGFSKWLSLSANELRGAGYPATTDLSGVNVRVEKMR